MKGSAIFFDAITTRQGTGFPFDVWYVNHYLQSLLAAGSYLALRRYGSPSLGTHLSIFEMDAEPAAVNIVEPGHEAVLKVERYFARPIGERIARGADAAVLESDFVYPVLFSVPIERQPEFDAWYDEEHLDILLRCPYWPMCRRFKVIDPAPGSPTHIALHYLTDLRALESDERTKARSTPWRNRLAAEPWFRGEYRVYYRLPTAALRPVNVQREN
jgi:hypothetical protein